MDTAAQKYSYWAPLLLAFVASITWLSHKIKPIANFGWAAIVMAGILTSSVIFLCVGIFLIGVASSKSRVSLNSQPNAGANSNRKALRITLLDHKDHTSVEAFSNGTVRRTTYLEVTNAGNGFLSECYLSIVSVSPAPKSLQAQALLFSGATLLPKQNKIIDFVAFNEVLPPNITSFDRYYTNHFSVFLHNPGFLAGHLVLDGSDPEAGCTFTIVAGAQECDLEKVHIRVRVEMPDRKLKAEII